MSKLPPDSLKPTATKMAGVLTSADGLGAARMLRTMGLFENPAEGNILATRPARRIGIWDPAPDNTWVRAPDLSATWGRWASVHKIPAKTANRRVVFLGESVARGFLYDPLFNVGSALQLMLRRGMGPDVEVVDLACTDQRLDELTATFEASFDLAPDAFVIFAGNNWGRSVAVETRDDAGERCVRPAALRDGGLAGLKRYDEEALAHAAAAFVQLVAARAEAKGVPVVLVVPDYNLVDWIDARPVAPWLRNGHNDRWSACAERARAAMAAGDLTTAAAQAAEMVELDEGVSPYSLYLLGECARRAGRAAEARHLLEQSRDAVLWDWFKASPRGFSVGQEALRREGQAQALTVIDLPKIFDAHLQGALPDRRLFIDYCHLSIEGIRVSMASTAAALLPLLGAKPLPVSDLLDTKLPVTDSVEAQAHFSAAIHNAHWGHDNDEVIEHHCKAALACNPAIRSSMRQYIELMTRRASAWMCSATEALAENSTNPSLIRYVLGMIPNQPRMLDRAFFGIITKLLGTTTELDELRIAEHGRDGRTISLLTNYLAVDSVAQREFAWIIEGKDWPGYFKAYQAESRFLLIENAPADVVLRLTARIPAKEGTRATVAIAVNGHTVLETQLGSTWSMVVAAVDAKAIRRGINEVTVRWPPPTRDACDALAEAADALELGALPEYYPIFGEVHALECSSR